MQNTDFVSAFRKSTVMTSGLLLLHTLPSPMVSLDTLSGESGQGDTSGEGSGQVFNKREVPINIQCDLQCCSLVEDVPDLGLEL